MKLLQHRQVPVQRWPYLAGPLMVGLIGAIVLLKTHASSVAKSIEAEAGNRTSAATQVADTSASGGYAVKLGTETARHPSDVFDLSAWNLTLPIDSMGGTGGTNGKQYAATTIPAVQLVTGFSDDYFMLDSQNQLVFTTPSNGATTTPGVGSDHTRSELHEIYTGPNAVSGGWVSSTGGSLQANLHINAVSVDSDEATIGQIHGVGSPAFVLLIYIPAKNEIALKVYSSPTTNTATETVIAKNITLNQMLTYSLAFKDGTITATVNGNTQTVTAGSDWDTYGVKFALGAYSAAPNTENPIQDETQVTFSSFTLLH